MRTRINSNILITLLKHHSSFFDVAATYCHNYVQIQLQLLIHFCQKWRYGVLVIKFIREWSFMWMPKLVEQFEYKSLWFMSNAFSYQGLVFDFGSSVSIICYYVDPVTNHVKSRHVINYCDVIMITIKHVYSQPAKSYIATNT